MQDTTEITVLQDTVTSSQPLPLITTTTQQLTTISKTVSTADVEISSQVEDDTSGTTVVVQPVTNITSTTMNNSLKQEITSTPIATPSK